MGVDEYHGDISGPKEEVRFGSAYFGKVGEHDGAAPAFYLYHQCGDWHIGDTVEEAEAFIANLQKLVESVRMKQRQDAAEQRAKDLEAAKQ